MGEVGPDDVLADRLPLQVQCGLDVQLLDARLEPELSQLLEDEVDEVRREEVVDGRLVNELLSQRGVHLVLRDVVLADHRLQDFRLAQRGSLRVEHGIPLGGRLGQACQDCRLG